MPAKKTNNKRKTTKRVSKKPYSSKNKQNVMKMLSPIIEKRKFQLIKEDSPTLINSQEMVLIPDVWEKMTREDEFHHDPAQLTARGFTGNTLFSRFLNYQQIIEFDAVSQIPYPVELEQLVGWFKTPYLTTEESAGLVARNAQGVVFNHDMNNYILRKIKNMLNDKFSTIDPKVVKVMSRKTYNIRGQSVDTLDGDGDGFLTDVVRKPLRNTYTWKPNRKYHMRPATPADGNTAGSYKPDDPQVYWTPSPVKNQDLWIPFVFFRFKNIDKFGKRRGNTVGDPNADPPIPPEPAWVIDNTAYPHLFHKETHYFTDL